MTPNHQLRFGRARRADKRTLGLLTSALLGVAACGGTPQVVEPPKPVDPQLQSDRPDGPDPANGTATSRVPAFIEASGEGATEAEAYDRAVAELEHTIYGDHGWSFELNVNIHDHDADLVYREETRDGQLRVIVGLERDSLGTVLAEIGEQDLTTGLPASLAVAFAPAYQMHLDRYVCERRQALLSEDCVAPREQDIADSIADVARSIELSGLYLGGLPLDANSEPLRPVVIQAERVEPDGHRIPLSDVPLIASQPDGRDVLQSDEEVTGADGRVRFEFLARQPWPARGLVITLDRERLLGPLASYCPPVEFSLAARAIGLKRWSLIATERVQGQQVEDGVFRAALENSLQRGGADPRVVLAPDTAELLSHADPTELAQALPELAEVWRGRIDILVVADLDSEYASRMSTYRVRYEARGSAMVFNVWTGERLDTIETTVTASGVGEARADSAARAELAETIAAQMKRVVPIQ